MTLHLKSCERIKSKYDDVEVWLQWEINYLTSITRTPHGDGALAAYRATLEQIERATKNPGA